MKIDIFKDSETYNQEADTAMQFLTPEEYRQWQTHPATIALIARHKADIMGITVNIITGGISKDDLDFNRGVVHALGLVITGIQQEEI